MLLTCHTSYKGAIFIITVVIIKLIIIYSYVKRLTEAKSQVAEN
jgi:hypothetical protein